MKWQGDFLIIVNRPFKILFSDREIFNFSETAVQAVEAGVGIVSIMDGRVRHCILKALSGEVFGSQIIKGWRHYFKSRINRPFQSGKGWIFRFLADFHALDATLFSWLYWGHFMNRSIYCSSGRNLRRKLFIIFNARCASHFKFKLSFNTC